MTKQPPMRFTFTILAIFMVPFLGYAQTPPPPAPNFTVMSSPTLSHRLHEDFLNQGKTVVLELFSVDCTPCNNFAPFMSGLYDEWGHGEEDVAFISLNIDQSDNFMDVAEFQMRHGRDWLGISREGESIEASMPYRDGTYGMFLDAPTLVVIAPDRTVNFSPNGTNLDSLGYMQLDSAIAATGAQHFITFNSVPRPLAPITCSDTDNLPSREDIQTTSTCGLLPTISSIDPFEEDLCNGYTITYRWRSIGACGFTREITTGLSVLPDTEPPTFDQSPPTSLPTIRSGEPSPPQDTLTASDNCSSAIVTPYVDTLNFSCCDPYTVAYRWVATDECGNSAEVRTSFVVRASTTPPSFEQDPSPIADVQCLDDLPVQETLTIAGGQCGTSTIAASIDEFVVDMCNGFIVTHRWVATNACGRTAERTRDFRVLPDTEGPIFDQEPLAIININCGQEFPNQEVLTAIDGCGEVIAVIPSVDEHEDLCNGLITVNYRWTAVDTCGNISERIMSFNVADTTTTTISTPIVVDGIRTSDDNGIPNVDLVFFGGIDTTITTSSSGQFLAPNLSVNSPFVVTPEKSSNILNGLTTFDLVLITRHILGIDPFSSFTQEIAADANQSNSVTTFDVVLLQQVILGLETTVPAGSWRFFPDATEFRTIDDLRDLAFIGIKVGDINNSADPDGAFNATEPRSYGRTLALSVKEQSTKVGDIIDVPFYLNDSDPLLGFQFTLDFDARALQYQGIRNVAVPNFGTANFNTRQKDRGQLSFSWFDIKEGALNDLFTLQFKVAKAGLLSDFIELNSILTRAEAYVADTEETVNISLDVVNSALIPNANLILSPNPTGKGITNLELQVTDQQILNIEILSMNGQLMNSKSYRADSPGLQQISLSTASLPTGVYFVSVEEKDGSRRYAKLVKK